MPPSVGTPSAVAAPSVPAPSVALQTAFEDAVAEIELLKGELRHSEAQRYELTAAHEASPPSPY